MSAKRLRGRTKEAPTRKEGSGVAMASELISGHQVSCIRSRVLLLLAGWGSKSAGK